MAIRFSCPTCLSVLNVADDQAGKTGPCPACNSTVRAPATPLPKPVPVLTPLPIVSYREGCFEFNVRSKAECKLAIQAIRVKKTEVQLAKKENMEEQRQVRAAYTDYVRRRGSRYPGGGRLGKFVRLIQTMSRDQQRLALANELAPYENRRREFEALLMACERGICEAEGILLRI